MFPLVAIAFTGWYLKRYVAQKGTEITVSFSDAKSISPEKTRVFYHGVPIGTVKDITLSKDGTKAICHISLQNESSELAVKGSHFYLITPKVGFEGISGLDTIVSGSYISIEPGKKDGDKQKEFVGELDMRSDRDENVTTYWLDADHAESISTGDNISFRGLNVGVVGEVKLSPTAQSVLIEANIKNKYAKLIRTNTAFWKSKGLRLISVYSDLKLE